MTIPAGIDHKIALHLVQLIGRQETSLDEIREGTIEAGPLNAIFCLDHLLEGIADRSVLENAFKKVNSRMVCLQESLFVLALRLSVVEVWISNLVLDVIQKGVNALDLLIQVGHEKVRWEDEEIQIGIAEAIPSVGEVRDRDSALVVIGADKGMKIGAVFLQILRAAMVMRVFISNEIHQSIFIVAKMIAE